MHCNAMPYGRCFCQAVPGAGVGAGARGAELLRMLCALSGDWWSAGSKLALMLRHGRGDDDLHFIETFSMYVHSSHQVLHSSHGLQAMTAMQNFHH